MIAIGIIAYGVDLPAQTVPGFIIYLFLGTATLSALGIAATSLAKSEDSAQPIGAFTIVMLSFVSGIFIPLDTPPKLPAGGRPALPALPRGPGTPVHSRGAPERDRSIGQ